MFHASKNMSIRLRINGTTKKKYFHFINAIQLNGNTYYSYYRKWYGFFTTKKQY